MAHRSRFVLLGERSIIKRMSARECQQKTVQRAQDKVMHHTCSDTPTTIPPPFQTHRIAPLSFPQPTTSPPTQNGFNALGIFNPSILFSSPSPSCTPFSRRATSNRGIAAAVPFRVCANGSGASDSVLGRYRIWRRRDW